MTTPLVSCRTTVVTPDTQEALRRLEVAVKDAYDGRVTVEYGGVKAPLASWEGVETDSGPLSLPAPLSMRPTGREVYLRLSGEGSHMARLAALWGIAIPLGFMPWDRYPVPSATESVFHYFGPWGTVADFLHGEGRGDLAWPSVCCAAQIDVGTWSGGQLVERTVQTHLHRLGVHCGPIDGEIGPVTLAALRSLGFGGMALSDAAEALKGMKTPPIAKNSEERQRGSLVLGGYPMEAFTSGGVHTVKTRTGYAITVDGPGRLILSIGEGD